MQFPEFSDLERKPPWLKTPIPSGEVFFSIKNNLREKKLFTVCEEAKCPNLGECWATGTATFMVLGDTCTRACRFCHVKTGNPEGWVDAQEPSNVAQSCKQLGLKYVVITQVDRDDMKDHGSSHIRDVLLEIKKQNTDIKVEILAGDYAGCESSLKTVLTAKPEVFAHNLETIKRLTPRVRDARANYDQSLRVLENAKQLASYNVFTKSALMLGLGEQAEEVEQTMKDLRTVGCDFLTIGQYMRPTKKHLSIKKWVHPDEFKHWKNKAIELGFKGVASSPLVRSSYKAREFYEHNTQ